MRYLGHVARIVERRGEAYTAILWGNLRERDYLGDQRINGRIILGWIFRMWDVWCVMKQAASG
jgi:hypothetical protein